MDRHSYRVEYFFNSKSNVSRTPSPSLSPVRVDDGAVPVGGDDADGDGRHEDGDGLDGDDALAQPLYVRPERPLLVEGFPQRDRKRAADRWREKACCSSLIITSAQMCVALKERIRIMRRT